VSQIQEQFAAAPTHSQDAAACGGMRLEQSYDSPFHEFFECLYQTYSDGIPGFVAGIMRIFRVPDKRSFRIVFMNFLHA
jgi:hypothetical protein